MLWRASQLPWRFLFRNSCPYNNTELRLPCIRNNFSTVTAKSASTLALPPQLPKDVKHSLLLGDGEPYLPSQLDGEVKVTGMVRSIRKQKQLAFAHISDGTTYTPIQAIIPPDLAQNITNGTYLELVGKWQPSPGAGQSHELQVTSVPITGDSDIERNPIQKQSMTADYLRGIPHLRLRTPFQSLLTRTRSRILYSITEFFEHSRSEAALQVQPPIITSSDCEGAGEVFTITPRRSLPSPGSSKQDQQLYFKEPKYLTVSSQLHLEAYSAELGNVWTLTPTFRAEESDTPRHLAEFYMLEAEFRGETQLENILQRVRDLIVWNVQRLREHRTGKELIEHYADRKHRPVDTNSIDLEERWSKLESEYRVISYSEAIAELEKAHQSHYGETFTYAPSWDTGLQLEHERWIVENLGGGVPIFITHYPRSIKPFYMLPSSKSNFDLTESSRNPTVSCFDLLLPYGYCEVAGGSLREHRLQHLVQAMRDKGLLRKASSNKDDESAIIDSEYPHLQLGESLGSLRWYADLRRHGSSPHGGFGLGFDRLLAYLTGVSNVRDVVGFPRTWGRADC